jgi:ferrous iron transport protein B
MRFLRFALVGNQNSGKTTLFNALTGASQHVGNFPGVTVEKKEGKLKGYPWIEIVDLPGIYSLAPYTAEERVARDYLMGGGIDCIINIIDATSLERGLYLTLQLLELGLPMVLALNMMDEVEAGGVRLDVSGIGAALGVAALPLSASKGRGIEELADAARGAALDARPPMPERQVLLSGAAGTAVAAIEKIVSGGAGAAGVSPRCAAVFLLEGNSDLTKRLGLSGAEIAGIKREIGRAERRLGSDSAAAVAGVRYRHIEKICRKNRSGGVENRGQEASLKIDAVLTNRFLALPVFCAVMFLVFWLSFVSVGKPLSELAERGISAAVRAIDGVVADIGADPILRSLVTDGILAGVGTVLSFLPVILVLFLLLSILEDSGYMARIAFIMDRLLRGIGLSGSSFVPMLIGFGCSVPAIMAARTMPSERDRKITVMLAPFMSCSAKLPIYAMFTTMFFPERAALATLSLYLLGIAVGAAYSLFFRNTVFSGVDAPFVMELPAYRMPSARSVAALVWRRAAEFVKKTFTIILLASAAVWFLQNFGLDFSPVEDGAQSILAAAGRAVAPVFEPLGFGGWQQASALITGLLAKETVVSTLTVLTKGNPLVMTPLSAYSFLVFTLLYMPCVAAMSAMRRELGSRWSAVAAMVSQTGIAWLVSFAVYRLGSLMGMA